MTILYRRMGYHLCLVAGYQLFLNNSFFSFKKSIFEVFKTKCEDDLWGLSLVNFCKKKKLFKLYKVVDKYELYRQPKCRYKLWFFFFEQAKMKYIISPKMIHLAQSVQKRTIHRKKNN